MSYPAHLITINKHYYFRITIPVDLKQFFPVTVIQKSLKTTCIKEAKAILLANEYKVQKVFALLRTGVLLDDMVHHMVNEIVPRKGRMFDGSDGIEAERIKGGKNEYLLSKVIRPYMN